MKTGQFLVIGVGRFGASLATSLFEKGHEVVAIDTNEDRIQQVMDRVTHAMVADATDPETLEQVGAANFDAVVVAIGTDFEANVLATVAAKEAGAKHVLSKALNETSAHVLSRVGADVVVRPEHDMGVRIAEQLTTPNLVDAFSLGKKHTVIEVEAQESIYGRLEELRLPNRFGVQVIAVHHGDDLIVSPGADYQVQRGDKLVLIGTKSAMADFRDHLAE